MGREQEENYEENQIEPITLIYNIISNWWVVLLGAVAVCLLMYVVLNKRYVPQYTTTATFAVSSKENANAFNNLNSANAMAKTFENIINSNAMKKMICEKLHIDEIDAKITTSVAEGTNLLTLSVTDSTAKGAIDMIRVIIDNYSDISFYTLGNTVMDILEEPTIPMSPDNPLNISRNIKKGFVIAVICLIGLIALISYLRDSIKMESDIERKLDTRNLGAIPYEKKYKTFRERLKRQKKGILVNQPIASFGFVESYKKLATNISYRMDKENMKVLVVTSTSENEGKSTVAANLSISLAEQGKRVVLIDGDLRRPSQFLILEKRIQDKNEVGEYLKGKGNAKDLLLKTNISNLILIGGRNCYSSSTELVNSSKMKNLIELCKKSVDYIIIDSPPASLMGDAEALAGNADAVMLVTKQDYILAEEINDILDSFREHDSKVLGVLLNGVRSLFDSSSTSYYGKYKRYKDYTN